MVIFSSTGWIPTEERWKVKMRLFFANYRKGDYLYEGADMGIFVSTRPDDDG